MCGIFGWIVPAHRRLSQTQLEALTDKLAHRGPDAGGYWAHSFDNDSWQVGFGHRRLAIIDLSPGGAQPMRTEDGHVIIFNGEIYNYRALRDHLEAAGLVFETNSDTEVLLKLLQHKGSASLPLLRGMFAFAYWNPGTQEVMLARDHFGKKPLLIAQVSGGGLIFSSELDPLTEFPNIDLSVDRDSVSEYFAYRYVPGPNTFFRAIKKLPPAHTMTWRKGITKSDRYYTPPFSQPAISPIPEREAEELFMFALRKAVSTRLQSDAPFGAFLSGGIDSATVVALMAQEMGTPVKTFSVGFRESAYSELEYARQIAARFATDHHEVDVPSSAVIDNLSEAILHRGAPVSEPSDIPILLLSKAARHSVKMVLTGEGSDELLGGYPKHRAEFWIRCYQLLTPEFVHKKGLEPLADLLPFGVRRARIALRAAGERDPEARFVAWFGATSQKERKTLLSPHEPARSADPFPFSATGSLLRRLLFFDQTSWLPDNLLERGDRMMMAGSIEGRMPFMDVDLADVVARLPGRLLIGGKGGKTILRRVAQPLLPSPIIKRKKVGFRVPVDEWFRSSLKDFVIETLLRGPRGNPLYASGAVESVLTEHFENRRNHDKLIWAMLNLELFFRQFKIEL